jgi:arsenate reductase-like glutaredoxin family protein
MAMSSRMEVQVFGVRKDADTRKALRFFSERRIKTHFVDFNKRSPSVGELRRFAQKHGIQALTHPTSSRGHDPGLARARPSEGEGLQRLSEEPSLLRMPLVRYRNQVTIGPAEETWSAWIQGG